MTNDVTLIICAVCACIISVCVFYLMRKGWINDSTVDGIAQVLESISAMKNGGIVDDLSKYAAIAVRAVEQLVKVGKIEKDNAKRQEAAVEIVRDLVSEQYSAEDAAELSYATIATVVDSEVNKLPRNNV